MWGLTLILAGAAGACSHGGRQTTPSHLFRDESEPSDGFQYYESATPTGEAGEKAAGGEASDTTIEVEVDDSADRSDAAAADEAATEDEGDGEEEGGEDEGDEEEEGGEESVPGSPR